MENKTQYARRGYEVRKQNTNTKNWEAMTVDEMWDELEKEDQARYEKLVNIRVAAALEDYKNRLVTPHFIMYDLVSKDYIRRVCQEMIDELKGGDDK